MTNILTDPLNSIDLSKGDFIKESDNTSADIKDMLNDGLQSLLSHSSIPILNVGKRINMIKCSMGKNTECQWRVSESVRISC